MRFECWALDEPDQFDPETSGNDTDAAHDRAASDD
jgi:hypothetical protein